MNEAVPLGAIYVGGRRDREWVDGTSDAFTAELQNSASNYERTTIRVADHSFILMVFINMTLAEALERVMRAYTSSNPAKSLRLPPNDLTTIDDELEILRKSHLGAKR